MPFNLLLLPLLGGFIFFCHWNRSKYFAKRQDKERLLLYSALFGVFLLGGSFFASILIQHIAFLERLRVWWAYNTPPIPYSGISSFAFGMGIAGCWLLNHLWPFTKIWTPANEGKRAILNYGSPLEQLLFRALAENKRVMVTLASGKVYIGRVATSLAPGDETAFYLLQTKSGYRDQATQRVEITTHYDKVYREIARGEAEKTAREMISDFGVVIPVREVVSATLYRGDIHDKYFPHEPSGQPSKMLISN
ncbi:MAG TPA: hypothetical protein VGN86_06125 [Pyrinomonadaceae bacterium]|jgi:hypothetical protein|nr:hypothetical protein [Pyrinomonadaceae bacterium]